MARNIILTLKTISVHTVRIHLSLDYFLKFFRVLIKMLVHGKHNVDYTLCNASHQTKRALLRQLPSANSTYNSISYKHGFLAAA